MHKLGPFPRLAVDQMPVIPAAPGDYPALPGLTADETLLLDRMEAVQEALTVENIRPAKFRERSRKLRQRARIEQEKLAMENLGNNPLGVSTLEDQMIEMDEDIEACHVDDDCGSDICELCVRATPHEVTVSVDQLDADGKIVSTSTVVQVIAVKLETLRALVDDNGEVTAWVYEES